MSAEETYTDLPPHYTEFATDLPRSFPIGNEQVAPVVNITEIQAHLRLLAAFDKLKLEVISQAPPHDDGREVLADDSTKDRLWVTFCYRAVYRFDAFMRAPWAAFPGWSEASILPLDVIMVWHSYLLNPRRYYEDSIRRTTPFARRLEAMETMPLTLIGSTIDPETLTPLPPSVEREFFFESLSGLPFMYSLLTTKDDTVTLTCPCCDTVHNNVPWITGEEGEWKGFAETNFSFPCNFCSKEFTREMMGVRKFCEEVTRKRANRKVYFPEALLQPTTGRPDEMLADMFNHRLLRRLNAVFKIAGPCEQDMITTESRQLAKGLDWNLNTLSVHLHVGLRPAETYDPSKPPLPKIQRILAAYSTPGYASLDLVAAVLRQGGFIEKMRDLGWLKPDRFQTLRAQGPLLRSIARYHAFLDVMSADTKVFLVPTLDIDLAWHTHQLLGAAYRADTDRLLKRIPNHDDNVGAETLQGGYDFTAAAWKARFGVPYSLCGCIPDGPTNSKNPKANSKGHSKKFSLSKRDIAGIRLKLPFRRSASTSQSLFANDTSILLSTQVTDSDASHPSEHNLHLDHKDGQTRPVQPEFVNRELEVKKRVQDIKSPSVPQNNQLSLGRRQNDTKEKETVDEWRKMQVERRESKPGHKEAFTTRPHWDGVYHEYWGVSVMTPEGFYGAVKYENAVAGCGSGCASCGYTPGGCSV